MPLNRRTFIRNSSIAALGAGAISTVPFEILAFQRKTVAASDKIRIGLIGCKGQGWQNISSMLKIPQVECAAICDIDNMILDQRKADLEKLKIKPKIYTDYRKLLENKNIDAVIVATPDHWHCLQMIDACAAGKDVFVEKPVANSIREAQLMVDAANKYNKIVQVAQWQRSMEHFKNAINFVQSGKLGKINVTKAWMYRGNSVPLEKVPDGPVPSGVDYNMWLGPAEKRPFNKNRFHYEFRWFWDYAGGLMTDWGVHLIDMVLMGMNADVPQTVMASGGKYVFPNDARETPDIQTAIYDFSNFQMIWEHNMSNSSGNYGMQHGIAFIGENGTLLLNRSGWEVRPDKLKGQEKMEAVAWQPSSDVGLDKHTVNFIETLKTRKKEDLNCPIEAGAKVAIIAHMGNVALRSGEKVYWKSEANKFTNEKANSMVTPEYHNGWVFPKV
jgi:predicted dehydrogenase